MASPYRGFILPGSTFTGFNIAVSRRYANIAVSQWYDNTDCRVMPTTRSCSDHPVMQYRVDGLTT